jgi:hypothetical protein
MESALKRDLRNYPPYFEYSGTAKSSDAQSKEGYASRIIEPVTSFISMLKHLGGVGVFILAALDSSVLPTLGAVDALTIVLAARHSELWPYYAMCSTAGSVCGASVAYRLAGLGVLHRRIKGAAIARSSQSAPSAYAGYSALHP